MLIIRPIRESDAGAFIELVYGMSLGMRSLPKNKERLMRKIKHSVDSFNKTSGVPEQERYLFVLEDTDTGQIPGTCAIWTAKGTYWNDQFYRIETSESSSPWTGGKHEIKTLNVVMPKEDLTENGSLYLDHAFRHHGVGELLSLSRFLFAAGHLNRFCPNIMAEMRGIILPDQTAPFWEGVGRHFCDVPFTEIMSRIDLDNSVISQILPRHPIYISLLPKEVQETIGAVHHSTAGALNMLLKEGFIMTNDIDLFDGGPKVKAKLSNLYTVKESRTYVLVKVTGDSIEGKTYILSNDRLDFRACYGTMQISSDGKATLTKEVADALRLAPGDSFRTFSH